MTFPYDEVPYPSLPLRHTRPETLAVQARLRGLPTADPARARVLEIGCSDAGNLACLAAYAPQARFLGVDLSGAAVARAQSHGLPNLEVIQADLRELDAGEFDYVIAHGVYSWLPQPDDLLACIDRHLATSGVAYVSYNAMPGWRLRDLAADVLRREAGTDPAAARALGESIQAGISDSESARAMGVALKVVLDKPDHVLRHDDLDPSARGFYIDEFAVAAARFGLFYCGESHLADCATGAESDLVRREQSHDYRVNRMFRMSLLSRTPPAEPNGSALEGMWVSARVAEQGRGAFLLLNGVAATVDPVLAADLRRIGAAWPASVAIADLAVDPEAYLALYRGRAVEISCDPCPAAQPQNHPYVLPFMRARAQRGELLTTWWHEPIRLEDSRTRDAVMLMDGKNSRAQIAEALRRERGERVREHVDDLLAGLAAKGLFLTPSATSAD